MTAADAYADRIDAVEAQAARLRDGRPSLPDLWGESALARLRTDPRRSLDAQLAAIAAYLRPDDVVLDVGGGAGRLGLALAGRCREVVTVEPSPGMGEAFVAAAAEAGITNARWVRSGWPPAQDIEGDVAVVSHVTYFVREIVPFVARLQDTARRRVLILLNSAPPPSAWAPYASALFGEALEIRPGHRELLPVLWDMGILPDVRVLPPVTQAAVTAAPTREEAIALALDHLSTWVGAALDGDQQLRRRIEEHFDTLVARTDHGFQARWVTNAPGVLITWQTDGQVA